MKRMIFEVGDMGLLHIRLQMETSSQHMTASPWAEQNEHENLWMTTGWLNSKKRQTYYSADCANTGTMD